MDKSNSKHFISPAKLCDGELTLAMEYFLNKRTYSEHHHQLYVNVTYFAGIHCCCCRIHTLKRWCWKLTALPLVACTFARKFSSLLTYSHYFTADPFIYIVKCISMLATVTEIHAYFLPCFVCYMIVLTTLYTAINTAQHINTAEFFNQPVHSSFQLLIHLFVIKITNWISICQY